MEGLRRRGGLLPAQRLGHRAHQGAVHRERETALAAALDQSRYRDQVDPAIQAAQTANVIATWALIVAIAAAIFTGWQALTMHLERQHTRTASLVMPVAAPGAPRTIKNEGGSAAHGVQVLVWGVPTTPWSRWRVHRSLSIDKTPHIGDAITGGHVRGSIPAGETVTIEGFGPRAEMFGPPSEVLGVARNLEVLHSPAYVRWRDTRGKLRHRWIDIR